MKYRRGLSKFHSVSMSPDGYKLLLKLAKIEDRTMQATMQRALDAYAAASPEFQAKEKTDD